MTTLKTTLYRLALGRRLPIPPKEVEATFSEMLLYLWKRGGPSYLRGLLLRHRLKRCGGRLFIGKKVDILFPRYISVGHNVSLGDYSHINGLSLEGLRIGDHVRVREHVWIQATSSLQNLGKGLSVGDNTYIGPRCILGAGGGITIGRDVTIGAAVDILAENHRFADADVPINRQGVSRQGITIDDDVWIGNRAIILDGVRVSCGAVIGAGAVVRRDVPSYTVVVGNPARAVGKRKSRRHPGMLDEPDISVRSL